jgi:Toprim domain
MLRKNGSLYFGEFLDLRVLVRKSNHEEVYRCPYCSQLEKSPDTEGKFYYNTVKQVGHCFKCGVIIVSDALRTPELIRQQLNTVPDEERYQFQKLALNEWTYPINENQECLDYMTGRGVYLDVLDRFNILATKTPKLGVVFCNKIWKDESSTITDFLIIRNLNATGHLRHTNIKNQVKPLLWCNHVDTDSVILVEGTVSGLSVYQHLDGKVSPLVILGKVISDFQLSQLKTIVISKHVEKIYIATDGGYLEHGIKIARRVYKALHRQDVFVLKLPSKKDPNSITRKGFKEVWENQSYSFQPLAANVLRRFAYGS